MRKEEIQKILDKQRTFFASGATLPVGQRVRKLRRLYRAIRIYEDEICAALKMDLGKSRQESYMCEIGLTLAEITHMIKHVYFYAAEKRKPTPLAQYVSRSFIKPSPYGTVLIMSPWNYPFLLTIEPLVDAIAAGNTCVVKPSAYSPATTAVIKKLIASCFQPEYVAVVDGGREENACLLEQKFDYIFFTGSQNVGKEVLRKAAEHLTPVSLELGGKSPCVVDASANIRLAARRIVFAKFLNCGQTCVAPDYIYCQESVREELLVHIRREIIRQFGEHPLTNPDYGKIVNKKHFDRIRGLIDEDKVYCGGEVREEELRIAPTVLENVTWDDAVMKEEIFGPVLPVLTYHSLEELIRLLNEKPHPLAAYYFSSDRAMIRRFTSKVQFGGGCINDAVIHLATSNMPFGGVGASGMGSYHGKAGFDTFSHKKSIVDKKTFVDLPMRYQPYTKVYDVLVRMFLR